MLDKFNFLIEVFSLIPLISVKFPYEPILLKEIFNYFKVFVLLIKLDIPFHPYDEIKLSPI